MRVEVFAICYNEEIMLPYFLRHYSRFCEKITIYDNYSTDRTLEICRENPLVEVIQYDSGNQIRDDIYLQIKNNCWKGSKADWVIVCDVDELMYGSADLDNYTIVSADWWEMVSEKIPDGPDQIYDYINQGICMGQITKCLMFRPDRIREINYHPGAHGINVVGEEKVLRESDMKILHYKYLSLEYVINRHAMFRDRLSDINKQLKWGVHYNNGVEEITSQYNSLQEGKKSIFKS